MAAKKKAGKKVTGNKAVATNKGNKALAPVTEDYGAGFEEATADAYAIPFLRVLQKGSPEVDENEGAYVKGAKAGMLYNTVTGDLFPGKEGALLVPCHFQQRFIRWAPRGGGGGFKGEFMPDEVAAMRSNGEVAEGDDGRMYFPDEKGNVDEDECDRLQDTRNHFVLLIDSDGIGHQALMPLASTQIKKSKQLMAMLGNRRVVVDGELKQRPTYSALLRVTTVPESNDQGSWFGVKFTLEGDVEDPMIMAMAKEFYKVCAAGKARVDYARMDPAPGEADAEGSGGGDSNVRF